MNIFKVKKNTNIIAAIEKSPGEFSYSRNFVTTSKDVIFERHELMYDQVCAANNNILDQHVASLGVILEIGYNMILSVFKRDKHILIVRTKDVEVMC